MSEMRIDFSSGAKVRAEAPPAAGAAAVSAGWGLEAALGRS